MCLKVLASVGVYMQHGGRERNKIKSNDQNQAWQQYITIEEFHKYMSWRKQTQISFRGRRNGESIKKLGVCAKNFKEIDYI